MQVSSNRSISAALAALEGEETMDTKRMFDGFEEFDHGKYQAEATGATVVTNDFNLSKVAELQGVRTLNVHQLAHALRPVFLPGEDHESSVGKRIQGLADLI